MATNTTGNDARDFERQMIHYYRRTISFDTPNIDVADTIKVGTLPAGAVITQAIVKINTAFDAGTDNLINVGTSADPDGIVDELDIDATAAEFQAVYRGCDLTFASATDVYVTYTQTGDAATAGEAEIIVCYIPDNDE